MKVILRHTPPSISDADYLVAPVINVIGNQLFINEKIFNLPTEPGEYIILKYHSASTIKHYTEILLKFVTLREYYGSKEGKSSLENRYFNWNTGMYGVSSSGEQILLINDIVIPDDNIAKNYELISDELGKNNSIAVMNSYAPWFSSLSEIKAKEDLLQSIVTQDCLQSLQLQNILLMEAINNSGIALPSWWSTFTASMDAYRRLTTTTEIDKVISEINTHNTNISAAIAEYKVKIGAS